jgi:c-di-GMP-binding flagellar brake protein YcgR
VRQEGPKHKHAASSTAERRRHRRFIEEVRVRYRDIEGVEPSRWGRSRDLSLGGLCLVGGDRLPEGCHIALEIHIENEMAPVLALGRVVRAGDQPDEGDYIGGVEFLWISEEDRANLQRLAAYFRAKYGDAGDLPEGD